MTWPGWEYESHDGFESWTLSADVGVQLHRNSRRYLEQTRPSIFTSSIFAFGKAEWEAFISDIGWVQVPDTCTTFEERLAWTIALAATK